MLIRVSAIEKEKVKKKTGKNYWMAIKTRKKRREMEKMQNKWNMLYKRKWEKWRETKKKK